MNNAIGYYGPTSLGPVSNNPLGSIVPANITLKVGEVQNATATLQLPPWNQLNMSQKKMVAAYVLQQRPNPTAQAQADQVLSGNPAFQFFTIIAGAAAL
jgi:hypothetical protein